jgi:hypothetical protein
MQRQENVEIQIGIKRLCFKKVSCRKWYLTPLSFNKLAVLSNIRPNRIFTADKNIIIKKVSSINENAFEILSS